jgi:signal transduction histidine kinase
MKNSNNACSSIEQAPPHADLNEMSYEFRTSLNTILMSVELLETEKAAAEVEDVGTKRYLKHIREAVGEMSDLLDRSDRLDGGTIY